MTLLNFDDIIDAQDRIFEDVDVSEWGGTVRIAVMSGKDRDAWEMSMMKEDSAAKTGFSLNFSGLGRANLVSLCLVDENMERVFTTKDRVESLSKKSGAVLDHLYEVAQRINGITDEDIDELEKNSAAAQNGDSGSD